MLNLQVTQDFLGLFKIAFDIENEAKEHNRFLQTMVNDSFHSLV